MAVGVLPALAQAPAALTAADYAHAEKFMGYNVNPLVDHGSLRPHWLADDRFWYRDSTAAGSQFIVVDAATGARAPAFDHSKLAAALSTAAGTAFDSHRLPFTEIEFSDDRRSVLFNTSGTRWKCVREGSECVAEKSVARADVTSPDKKRAAFIRDYNLWVRELASGKETQLTKGPPVDV
jgi:hypothetical protein